MNHSFISSQLDSAKCARCSYDEISHTNRATCECCSNSGEMNIAFGMLLCESCADKERALQTEHKANEQNRVLEYNKTVSERLAEIKANDNGIELRTDIFNAKMASIVEIKSLIESDSTLSEQEKVFKIAETLKMRHEHLSGVIFRAKNEIVESGNEQRAIQVELNLLSNKLRQEERDKLKLSDINYQPSKPKLIKPRAPSVKKFDKSELKKFAQMLQAEGLPATEQSLQVIVARRNCTVADAARILKEMLLQ